jgi:hypothetical protein
MEKPINNSLSAYYNSNKQQQPYMDDDLVSDYSTVIRNSQIVNKQPPITNYTKPSSPSPPERPSIPLDMDLIATSPRLSTLVESNINTRQLQLQQQRQQQQQQQRLQQQQQQQQQQRVYQQQQQQQQQSQYQRPMSHQPPLNNNNLMNDWKRNTVNPVKSDQVIQVYYLHDFHITKKNTCNLGTV